MPEPAPRGPRPRPRILGHRGSSARLPENSLAAILDCLEEEPRADGFECDVRLSADDVAVVFHDDETARLTGEPGTIEARTAEALGALRVRGEPIPTLAGLVDACTPALRSLCAHRGATVNIELKPTGRAERAVHVVRPELERLAAIPGLELVLSSFDPRVVAALLRARGPWRSAFLFEEPGALALLPDLEALGPLDLHPDEALTDAALLGKHAGPAPTAARESTALHRAFRIWTVDDPARALALAELGVDALISNVPHTLARLFDHR